MFFTRESKDLEGDRLPVCSLSSCRVKCLKRADCPVCEFGWENRKNNGVDVRLEEGPKHSTSDTLTHDVAQYGLRIDAGIVQELFQLT